MHTTFIRGVHLEEFDNKRYPFSIPAVRDIESINFTSPVTFFVGENGSGKSTIVEAIAVAADFNAEGGTKNYSFSSQDTSSPLKDTIRLVRGATREKYGYFLRAESFYTTANYAESGTFGPAGPEPILFNGKHIHEQSHGEAFLSIIASFRPGLFIFDEPESALSPQRQLALLVEINELVKRGSQFIIATHSPILLAYPNAIIYHLSDTGIDQVNYEDVEHVKLSKDFLNNPTQYLRRLF
jgi:predicted ATPase